MTGILTLLGWCIVVIFGYVVVLVVFMKLFPRRCPACRKRGLEIIGGCKTSRGPRRLQVAGGYCIWKCTICECVFVDHNGKLSPLQSDDPYNEAHELVFGRRLPQDMIPPECQSQNGG
ncbi:hypothetical protein Pla52n_44320 [Stieleria varia]|uniref:Uncharacterized protein n=1 Tax=Stieleria varia TaxID=2528005 RepID=A0A5C6ANQ9_9BACT|nr:hypothetical protein Pla52n_44320 [Stieleria varia]